MYYVCIYVFTVNDNTISHFPISHLLVELLTPYFTLDLKAHFNVSTITDLIYITAYGSDIDNMDNHANLQRYIRSFQNMMPPTIANYISINLDTIPKVTNHVLLSMSISNFFLLINSMRATFITFLAASLLAFQTCFVVMVTSNNRISFAPRVLEPTEFMVGLCLGICIGGVILAFFVSVTFGRVYSFCKYAETNYSAEDNTHACGNKTNSLWSIWWWSSSICWSNILLTYLVAVGREDINQTQQQQYNSIDSQASSVSNLTEPYHAGQPPSSFQQDPQMQHQQQQPPPPPQQNDQRAYGDYTYPDVSNSAGAKVMPI